MIPNPWMILGAIFVAVSVYFYGHHRGWDERDAEMQAEIATKNEESRVKEQELAKQLNEQSSKLLEANNAISEKQSSLDRAIRAGRVRLPSSSCPQTSSNTPVASGNSNQTGSQPTRFPCWLRSLAMVGLMPCWHPPRLASWDTQAR